MKVRRYRNHDRPAWDAFVRSARNGSFPVERGYMDYHAERFDDTSLVVQHGDGALRSLLPAHREHDTCVSHGGLTFGGLVMHPCSGAHEVRQVFEALIPALRELGFVRLRYRPAPHIFHRRPSEDDLYAMHLLGARTVRMDLSTTVDLGYGFELAKGRKHALAQARRAGVEVRRSDDYGHFWPLLEGVLDARHGTRPTHTLFEMQLLAERCETISLWTAHRAADGDSLLAGAVIYDYGPVLHTQYLASSPEGRDTGALDAVLAHVVNAAAGGKRWLNFGASTEDEGRTLNIGLLAFKEMFGGRSTVLRTLELDLQ